MENVARKTTKVLIPQNSLTAGKETTPVAIRVMGKTITMDNNSNSTYLCLEFGN